MRQISTSAPQRRLGVSRPAATNTGTAPVGVAFAGGRCSASSAPVQHSGREPGAPAGAPQQDATFAEAVVGGLVFAGLLALLIWGPALLEVLL
jgi:hypothetical protein